MDAVEDIKSRLNIEDVIGQYIELKRSGRNFKGLSPFTGEKTASFMVSPEKQIWHDFSSSKGGNMFSFVMEMEGLDFKAALEMLARQAGVDLSQYRTSGGGQLGKQRERLMAANELAARFYQTHLTKSKSTLEYVLKERQFTKDTALAFRLGYSPNQGDALTIFLKKKGFNDQEIKRAGLATTRYNGLGDMFRSRLMIPLMDPVGNVIGFTARILGDDPKAPKYINTPQTPLYDKSRHVFGLHLAKQAIRQANSAVVVEGNMDVIASYQAEVKNVVATAGTAVTEMHFKALARLTSDIRLAFDQDEAGLQATERAIPIASKVGVTLSMVPIPRGKDPDELIRKDSALWQKTVNKPVYAIDWLIDRYKQLLDITTAQGKRQFTDNVLAVLKNVDDRVEQDHYISQLAKLIGVEADSLRAKLEQISSETSRPKKRSVVQRAAQDPKSIDLLKNQHQLLALVYSLPSLREFTGDLRAEIFSEDEGQKVLKFLKAHPDFNAKSSDKDLLTPLREINDYVKMLVLLYEELYQNLEVLELRYEAKRLQSRLIDRYVKIQKAKLVEAMSSANDDETDKLLAKAKQLDILLKTHKGDSIDG